MGLRHVTPRVKRPTSMAVPLPSWAVGDTSQETDSANSIAVSHQSLLLVSMQCSESSVLIAGFHAMLCLLLICIRLLCLLSGSALACLCCFKKKRRQSFFFCCKESFYTALAGCPSMGNSHTLFLSFPAANSPLPTSSYLPAVPPSPSPLDGCSHAAGVD